MANVTSCIFADGNHLFYTNTSDSGPMESTQSISSSGIRGYRSGSYQRDSVLYYLLAGEE